MVEDEPETRFLADDKENDEDKQREQRDISIFLKKKNVRSQMMEMKTTGVPMSNPSEITNNPIQRICPSAIFAHVLPRIICSIFLYFLIQ